MPLYAYKCESCGFSKDALQKMSDAPLTVCPSCGADTFRKQVTAAGFQLKGSGWYVTDFRDGNKAGAGKSGGDKPADAAKPEGAAAAPKADAPAAAPAAAATPAPAPSSGGGDS
ncbi:FmdB family zinc ribbon protein [Xylophilus sp. GW821-FHT01B05]